MLAIAVLLRLIGDRMVPVVMSCGRLRAIALGWLGGLAGTGSTVIFANLGLM
ncbi:hypothetical protein ACFLWY_01095 [Chloroflexota bacterium]